MVNRKITIIAVILSLIFVTFQNIGAVSVSNNNIIILEENFNDETTRYNSDEGDYYAIIAACSDYDNLLDNIPKGPFPIPERKLIKFYEALIESENWIESNIILLLNSDATNENIINAIDEMSTRVGHDDYFLFSWQGHGGRAPDNDGDEKIHDSKDEYDEVIFPYDVENYIRDDELCENFSKINAKAMCLIFESCLSGGLINISRSQNIIYNFNKDFKNDIIKSKVAPLDIDGDNRVILLSSLPFTLSSCVFLIGFPMTRALAFALKGFSRDKNNDGFISIEETFKIVKILTLFQSLLTDIGMWIFFYLFALLSGVPFPGVLVTLSLLFAKVTGFISDYILKGYFSFNWPNIHDTLDGDFPLVKI
jgi:hypothetical protein